MAGSGSESGSIRQRHGSADPDPDPPQNVMDPQHWGKPSSVWNINNNLTTWRIRIREKSNELGFWAHKYCFGTINYRFHKNYLWNWICCIPKRLCNVEKRACRVQPLLTNSRWPEIMAHGWSPEYEDHKAPRSAVQYDRLLRYSSVECNKTGWVGGWGGGGLREINNIRK